MKDKDEQSAEFEQDMALNTSATLRGLIVDINTSIDSAKKIADTYIRRGPGGRELALAITDLQRARMWTNEALFEVREAAK